MNGLIVLILMIAWEAVWKLVAMWQAAKRDSKAWFVALAVLNTVGILPILYLIFYTDFFKSKKKAKSRRRK